MKRVLYVDSISENEEFAIVLDKEKIAANLLSLNMLGVINGALENSKSGSVVMPIVAGFYVAIVTASKESHKHRMYFYKPENGKDFQETVRHYMRSTFSNAIAIAVYQLSLEIQISGVDDVILVARPSLGN